MDVCQCSPVVSKELEISISDNGVYEFLELLFGSMAKIDGKPWPAEDLQFTTNGSSVFSQAGAKESGGTFDFVTLASSLRPAPISDRRAEISRYIVRAPGIFPNWMTFGIERNFNEAKWQDTGDPALFYQGYCSLTMTAYRRPPILNSQAKTLRAPAGQQGK